jgi:SAM-dependent methyltransferase
MEGVSRCPEDGHTYRRERGIWRLLHEPDAPGAAKFLARYQAVRQNEGWGAEDGGYYRALPFEDRSGRHRSIWRIRALTYRLFERKVLQPLEAARQDMRVLDLGAGNGWLSHRLAGRGHEVAAVDLNLDPRDGLGAHVHYPPEASFAAIEASFDHLPWPDQTADLAIFNGSLHYSTHYGTSVREALRVLAPGGQLAILDSPFYRRDESGEAMLRERAEAFRSEYGGDAGTANEGFLTPARLDELGQDLGITWQVLYPYGGVRAALRPLRNRILGRREQARFPVVVGSRTADGSAANPPAGSSAAGSSGR